MFVLLERKEFPNEKSKTKTQNNFMRFDYISTADIRVTFIRFLLSRKLQ